jgi:hypothetical protein
VTAGEGRRTRRLKPGSSVSTPGPLPPCCCLGAALGMCRSRPSPRRGGRIPIQSPTSRAARSCFHSGSKRHRRGFRSGSCPWNGRYRGCGGGKRRRGQSSTVGASWPRRGSAVSRERRIRAAGRALLSSCAASNARTAVARTSVERAVGDRGKERCGLRTRPGWLLAAGNAGGREGPARPDGPSTSVETSFG